MSTEEILCSVLLLIVLIFVPCCLCLSSPAAGEKGEGVGGEAALKALLVMVDVRRLYHAALATYNFDLVLMVAEASQMVSQSVSPRPATHAPALSAFLWIGRTPAAVSHVFSFILASGLVSV